MNGSETLHNRQERADFTTGRVGMKGAARSTKHDEASTAAERGARVERAGAFKFSAAAVAAAQSAAATSTTAGETL